MAFSAATVWEAASTGFAFLAGSFTAGASGTDYSQQDAPQYSLTGMSSAGVGAVVLTASAAADMVGNGIRLQAGTNFTVGWYEIISVVVGVSFTVDRNCTSGVGSGGECWIGGRPTNLATTMALIVAGNKVWIKGVLAAHTATQNLAAGASGAKVVFEGYTTTRGDGGYGTITCATNNVSDLAINGTMRSVHFKNVKFISTATARGDGLSLGIATVDSLLLENCVFDGCLNGLLCTGAGANYCIFMVHCEIKNCTSDGLELSRQLFLLMSGCYVHDNVGHGLSVGGSVVSHVNLHRCIIESNGYDGIRNTVSSSTGYMRIDSCVISKNTSDGIQMTGSVSLGIWVTNSIFWDNGAWGIDWSATAPATQFFERNAFGSNASGDMDAILVPGVGDVALSVDPFTNSAAGDFTLNNTSGGGADLKAVGFPQTIP